jgi:hypothetical protein
MKLKNYFKPTPKRFRVLGDSLASASVFVSSYAILNDHQNLGIAILVSGWVGKFLTNFFADGVEVESNEQPNEN